MRPFIGTWTWDIGKDPESGYPEDTSRVIQAVILGLHVDGNRVRGIYVADDGEIAVTGDLDGDIMFHQWWDGEGEPKAHFSEAELDKSSWYIAEVQKVTPA